jgi:hypothetical protein
MELPEVVGQTFKNTTVALDGKSFRSCRFENCHIVYRGGPARCSWCWIGPGRRWELQDNAAFEVQLLSEIGWKLTPPAELSDYEILEGK